MPEILEPPKETFVQKMAAAAKSGTASSPAAPKNNPEISAVPPEPKSPAPPPTPVTALAPAADPDDEILSGKRSPKADDFRRVKQGRDEAKKIADEFKAKLEPVEKELVELKKAPKHNAELIKKLETERDDFKGKYEAFIVQFTPEFQTKFDSRISEVVTSLKGAIPEAEAGRLAELMQLPDSEAKRRAISEITEAMDQFQVAEVVAANQQIRRINAERREAVTKANQTLTTIAQDRQKQAEESKTRLGQVFDETLASASQGDKAIPVYQTREGDAEWNRGVAERAKVARAVFHMELDDGERAQAAIWAAAAPGILASAKASLAAKDAELAEAKATIQKLQGSNPGLGTGSGNNAASGKKTFTERMMEATVS